MSRKVTSGLLALILTLLWTGGQGWTQTGKIFYVSTRGDDAHPGTAAKPWRTLQHAAEQVQAGDTVYVQAGTYAEEVRLTRSGQKNAPITFAAAPQENVTVQHFFLEKGLSYLRLQDFSISGFKVWGVEVSGDNHHLQFSGLKIVGGECGVRLTVGSSGEAPEYGPVSHITMENCVIQGPLYAGVDGTPGPCNYLTFRRVEVSGAGQSGGDSYAADGISIEKGHHITVEDCNIHDNGGDGIDLNSRDRGGQVPGIVVRRNVVVRNHRNGIKLWSGGLVEGNLVWGQGDTPLTIGPYRGRAEVIYNTVAYNMWAREFGGRNYAATIGYPESGIARPQVSLVMHHNIFAFNSGPAHGEPTGIYLGPGVHLLKENHNLFFSRSENEILAAFLGGEREFSRRDINQSVWSKTTGQGKGDLSVNPQFVSGWPKVDLRLKSGSPAAGRGAYGDPSTAGSSNVRATIEKPIPKTRVTTSGIQEATPSTITSTTTAEGPSSPGITIFSDTFEDGWDSRWHFTEKASVVSDTEGKGHILSLQDHSFADIGLNVKDFTLDFLIKPAKENLEAPIVQVSLRLQGEPPQQSAYQVIFFQQRIEVQREINQKRRTLALAQKGLTPKVWQKVSIKLVGGEIDVSLDDKPVLNAKDSKNLSAGIVAFFCHGGSPGFAIDYVYLTSIDTKKSK